MGRNQDYESKKVELENLLNNGMIDLEMYKKETEILDRKIKVRDARLEAEEKNKKRQKIEGRLAVLILVVCFSIFIIGIFARRWMGMEII
jgi:cytochrome c-type biogenesis protein CcmH/NrfG